MKNILLCLVISYSLSANLLMAQNPLTSSRALEAFVNSSGQYLMQIEGDNTVSGSPYLREEFIQGDIHLAGVWYKDIDMRYDIYNKVFEIKLGDQLYGMMANQIGADTIIYKNETFILKNLGPGKAIRLHYLSLLIAGDDHAFCKQYRIRLNNAVPSDGYSEAKPAEFKANSPAYYYFNNERYWEIEGSKQLLEIFDTDSKELKTFLKKNKYKFSKEDDLVEVINYLTSNYPIKSGE